MNLTWKTKDNILIVHMDGDIDHHSCEALRTEIDAALERMRCKHILFCFDHVAFMDSSGIGVLIGRYKLVQRFGGRIAVCCAGERIREIFRLSALDQLFPSFAREDEAVFYLKGSGKK